MGKCYVVFDGKKPGIYKTWEECQKQTKGVKGAKFRSFPNYDAAKKAFDEYLHQDDISQEEIEQSISVDAACSSSTKKMEYRVVATKSGDVLISETFPIGTNNIGEFLALVDAMKYLEDKDKKDIIIFTDSITAMSWVRNKNVNTKLPKNNQTKKLYKKIEDAVSWLKQINTDDFRILKWETHLYGEIKADYGRK